MNISAFLCLIILFVCGCNEETLQTKLLREQKLLKDSTFVLNERIGRYQQKEQYYGAKEEQEKLGAVYARLIAIQSSIDSLANLKNIAPN